MPDRSSGRAVSPKPDGPDGGAPFRDRGETYDPRAVLEALEDARAAMGASTHHDRMLEIAGRVVRAYAREHGIPLGPPRARQVADEVRKRDAVAALAESGDVPGAQKGLRRLRDGG